MQIDNSIVTRGDSLNQSINQSIIERKENQMTPYEFAKVVNAMLKTNLPPQMFYTYAKKGFIASTIVNGKINLIKEGPKGYDAWLIKRINKMNGVVVNNVVLPKMFSTN